MSEEGEVTLSNPAPPPDVDLEKLRGDRIGDTVFSEKWCIQTVMKLMQSNVVYKTDSKDDNTDIVDMDEDLQNEVGALWDMTSNVQVCQYLHSIGAVESICYVITNSRCPRATEMCVGMLANIINHKELWDIMKQDMSFFSILIQLLTSTDQPVLLEVNRFFNTALFHKDNDVFYNTLNENSDLVTQELLRILSASTNAELLKQVAELVYGLMYRDEDDAHFNTKFAHPDFVTAVVEASKELGWSHESPGQNSVMEIFHLFTTFNAGIESIGPSLLEMSCSGERYLRVLCQHGLSLASNCSTLTSIISTLHHIMSRSSQVHATLLSSVSFLHCVLMTLVALYRKLGLYHTISHDTNTQHTGNEGHHHHRHHQDKQRNMAVNSSWQSMEESEKDQQADISAASGKTKHEKRASPDSEGGASKRWQPSWSERALTVTGSGDGTNPTLRTPEASPRLAVAKGLRGEFDVSWSERRLASPLVTGEEEEREGLEEGRKWKRPMERGGRKKRGGNDTSDKTSLTRESDSNECLSSSPGVGGLQLDAKMEDKVEGVLLSDTNTDRNNAGVSSSVSSTTCKGLEDSSDTLKAMKIKEQTRMGETSRVSGGFEPSNMSMIDSSSHNLSPDGNTAGSTSGECSNKASCNLTDSVGSNSVSQEKSMVDNVLSSSATMNNTSHSEKNEDSSWRTSDFDGGKAEAETAGVDMDVGFDYVDKDMDEDDDENCAENNSNDLDLSKSCGATGGRYTILLEVITDLLVDYMQSLTQICRQQGNPDGDQEKTGETATLTYLDRQCSGKELRALAKCVSETTGGHSLIDDLIHHCGRLGASRLRSVLIALVWDWKQ